MTKLRIPAPEEDTSEVQLVEWRVTNGAIVQKGDVIYTVESDKSVLEIAAPSSGTLSILAPAAQIFPVGHLVARIG